MAKLSTKGTATMEFDAEIMKFKIIFEEKGTDVASTLGKVQKQTEQFLGELMDIGIRRMLHWKMKAFLEPTIRIITKQKRF